MTQLADMREMMSACGTVYAGPVNDAMLAP